MNAVRVPASSANLGPGFDTLGIALGLYLECRWESAPLLRIEVTGTAAEGIPADETNLIWRTIAAYNPAPIHLRIHNEIPLGKGLGSSAAALLAGIAIGNPQWGRREVMQECARLEGHPDNACASALGGIVASASRADGTTEAIRIPAPAGMAIGIAVPNFALPTSKARAALPDCYSRADVVFNLQRTALLVAALATGTTGAMGMALEDTLHQPYRAALVPGLAEILALRLPGLLGCVLSGAGPSALIFFEAGGPVAECCARVASCFPGGAQILTPAIDSDGYSLHLSDCGLVSQ